VLTVRIDLGKSDPHFDAGLLEIACLHGNAPLDLLLRLIDEERFDTSLCKKIFNDSAQRDTLRDLYPDWKKFEPSNYIDASSVGICIGSVRWPFATSSRP
jgi:hypothetical protein